MAKAKNSIARNYSVYVARLNGTDAQIPTATVIEKTISSTITITNESPGQYSFNFPIADTSKVFAFLEPTEGSFGIIITNDYVRFSRQEGAFSNCMFVNAPIEIRVYS